MGPTISRPPARIAVGHVDRAHPRELSHPRQLTLRVVARAALHRLHVARSSRSSKPSALRAVCEAPAACALRTSSRDPCGDHRIDARVDARIQRLALHRQPHQQCRMAQLLAPQLRRAVRRLELSPRRAARARAPSAAVVLVDPLGAQAARLVSSACSAGAPCLSSSPSSARAHPRAVAGADPARSAPRAGTGQCRRQQWSPPGCEQPVDLSVCELGVLPHAERRVERQERHQAMLELCLLAPARPLR